MADVNWRDYLLGTWLNPENKDAWWANQLSGAMDRNKVGGINANGAVDDWTSRVGQQQEGTFDLELAAKRIRELFSRGITGETGGTGGTGGTGNTGTAGQQYQPLFPRQDLQNMFSSLYNVASNYQPYQHLGMQLPQGGLGTYLRFRAPWQ